MGEDWVREQTPSGIRFRLERDDANVSLTVYRVPRPRGAPDDALDEVVDDLREELARRGIVGDDDEVARIDGAEGRGVVFRGAHAGRPVHALVRAVAQGTRFGIVACITPQGIRDVDPRCRGVLESLTLDAEPSEAPAGSFRAALGPASVVVPDGWIEVTATASLHALHSEAGHDATRVTVEGGDDDGGADAIFEAVDGYHATRNATVLRRVRTRARGSERLELEATFTEPPGLAVQTRLALRGRYVYILSCAEPGEVARGRCPPVLASFRFDAP